MTDLKNETIDAFVSGSLFEADSVKRVVRALESAGLGVASVDGLKPGSNWSDEVRSAIAEASAFVLVIDPASELSPNAAVELGAAMAWPKRVFVINASSAQVQLPSFLSDAAVYPIARVGDVATAILESRRPLTDKDIDTLQRIYTRFGVPTDRLARDPILIDEFVAAFNRTTKSQRTAERLVREMMRLRKEGKWPRLAVKKHRGRRRTAAAR
jgi:TIR domain